MNRALCILAALTLSAACDAQDQAAATAATAPAKSDNGGSKTDGPASGDATKGSGDPAPAAGTAGPAPLKFSGLSDCLRSCEAADVIPTNRETCRLNCDTVYGAQPPVAGGGTNADPVGQAATCFGRCYATPASGDTCASSCKDIASKAASPPAADVVERLGTCVRTCHVDKSVLPTNRATCELNCTQAARVAGPAQPASAASTK